MTSFLSIILVIWLLLCAALYFMQDTMLFPRHMTERVGEVKRLGLPAFDVLHRDIEGGKVEAWFIPGRDTSAAQPAPLAVFFHGNAELIDHQLPIILEYHNRGWHLLLPEYRGYGDAAGVPSETALIEDAAWFIEQVRDRPDVRADHTVYHGRSLGGGVAMGVAERLPPDAIILESTFTSVSSFAWRYAAPPLLVRNPFRNDERIQRYPGPVLLFHGEQDQIIPIRHSRVLAELHETAQPQAGTTLVELADVHHLNMPGEHDALYWEKIDELLSSVWDD